MQINSVQYSTVQFRAVQYSSVQNNTVQLSAVQHSTVQTSVRMGCIACDLATEETLEYMGQNRTLDGQLKMHKGKKNCFEMFLASLAYS